MLSKLALVPVRNPPQVENAKNTVENEQQSTDKILVNGLVEKSFVGSSMEKSMFQLNYKVHY